MMANLTRDPEFQRTLTCKNHFVLEGGIVALTSFRSGPSQNWYWYDRYLFAPFQLRLALVAM